MKSRFHLNGPIGMCTPPSTANPRTSTGWVVAPAVGVLTSTLLTVLNAFAVAETPTGGAWAASYMWDPIPDTYSDIYNNLFLSEVFMLDSEPAQAQMYRQRGIAAFLAKASGLTETQKNAFIQQWQARDLQSIIAVQRAQQGTQARAV